MNVGHSQKITEFIKRLHQKEGEYGFYIMLSNILRPTDYSEYVHMDMGIEEEEKKESYVDDLSEGKADWLMKNAEHYGCNVYQIVLETDSDIIVIYFLGEDEDSLLEDLQGRVQELVGSDI